MSAELLLAMPADSSATDSAQAQRNPYIPKFTATVLGRYEFNTQTIGHHFELRHTRIGVYGQVHPSFSYMALVDLTFGGKFSPVAIFAQYKPIRCLSFLIGYDKMPFSNENLLSPYQYYFSDKSFLTQKLTAWSDVGGVVTFEWDKVVPFTIKAGVFNSAGFSRQGQFQKHLNYVARGTFELFKGFKLSLNYAAVMPDASVRMHHMDAGIAYDWKQLHLETEYIYKFYGNQKLTPVHALYGFAYYRILLEKKGLSSLALGLRYDAITPNSNLLTDEADHYIYDNPCQRLTAGVTLFFVEKPVRAGIRIDYEKFFFHKHIRNEHDRLICELIVHL